MRMILPIDPVRHGISIMGSLGVTGKNNLSISPNSTMNRCEKKRMKMRVKAAFSTSSGKDCLF